MVTGLTDWSIELIVKSVSSFVILSGFAFILLSWVLSNGDDEDEEDKK